MPKILLAGQDDRLLETRAAVLRTTGSTIVACDVRKAIRIVGSEAPDLVVLCHTLSMEESEMLADLVRDCCPETKILLVLPDADPNRSYPDGKFDAITVAEPLRLIGRVKELLRTVSSNRVEDVTAGRQGSAAP